jgi:hypothetical protein
VSAFAAFSRLGEGVSLSQKMIRLPAVWVLFEFMGTPMPKRICMSRKKCGMFHTKAGGLISHKGTKTRRWD